MLLLVAEHSIWKRDCEVVERTGDLTFHTSFGDSDPAATGGKPDSSLATEVSPRSHWIDGKPVPYSEVSSSSESCKWEADT